MSLTVSMADLNALKAGECIRAKTDDIRTPEIFMKFGKGETLGFEGNNGSILLISGAVSLQFADGHWIHLSGYKGAFHCRTPVRYQVTAIDEAVVKILGECRPSGLFESPKVMVPKPANLIRTSDEAFYTTANLFAVGASEMTRLREEVVRAPRHRVRLCAHRNAAARLHEMFVSYTKTTSIAPHKHLAKDESFHILEGELDFIMFTPSGDVLDIIPMGDRDSGRPFYVRVPRDTFHTVAMTSDYCILHEGTAGPFDRAHTVQMGVTRST